MCGTLFYNVSIYLYIHRYVVSKIDYYIIYYSIPKLEYYRNIIKMK